MSNSQNPNPNPNPIIDTIIVETNRKFARYDELEPDSTNARWTSAIDGGLVIEKGDKISIEATAINSIGGDENEIELKGMNLDGIYDNKVAMDFNYYLSNRQQFNINLPKMDHLNSQDFNGALFGAPDLTSYQKFLRNYYFDNLEGLLWNDGSSIPARTDQKWEVLFNSNYTPKVSPISGEAFFKYHTNSVQNAPVTINESNNQRLFVGQKDWTGPYLTFDGETPITVSTDNEWKRFTRRKAFDVSANFLTPSSIASYMTEELHSRLGAASEFSEINDKTVEAASIFPYIPAFYDVQNLHWDLTKEGAAAGQGRVKQAAVTDLSMATFPTVTGRITQGWQQNTWGNPIPYNAGLRLEEFYGPYKLREGYEMYYMHMMAGDITRCESFALWHSLAGKNRFTDLTISTDGSNFVDSFREKTCYAGNDFEIVPNTGWFGYQTVLMDNMPSIEYDFFLQYTNLNRVKASYDIDGLFIPGKYGSTPLGGGEYVENMKLWLVRRGDIVTTNMPYTKANATQLNKWLQANRYPVTFYDRKAKKYQKDVMVADLNVGSTDDANSCGVSDQYTYLNAPWNANFALYSGSSRGMDGVRPNSYGFFNNDDEAASTAAQTTYEVSSDTAPGTDLLVAAFRYKNIRGNRGARDTKVRVETDYRPDMIPASAQFNATNYNVDFGNFSTSDTLGRFYNDYIQPEDVIEAPIIPTFLKARTQDIIDGKIATVSAVNNFYITDDYAVGDVGEFITIESPVTIGTYEVIEAITHSSKGAIKITNRGEGYITDQLLELTSTTGTGAGATVRLVGVLIGTNWENGFVDSNLANIPFCGFILAQDGSKNQEEYENNIGDTLPHLIPWPFSGELFGPSRSLYDGEYSQIASSEKIQDSDSKITDSSLVPEQYYDDGLHYMSSMFDWDRTVPSVQTGARWQGSGQWTNIYAYKPYVFIGADDPALTFDTPSSRFGFSQLATPVRAGNKSAVWYQGRLPGSDPPPDAYLNILQTPYPKSNSNSSDQITSFKEYETSFIRLVGFQDPDNQQLIIYRPGSYTPGLFLDQGPGFGDTLSESIGGRQNSELTSPISTQAGIAIENLFVQKHAEFVKILSNKSLEYQESLWQRLGFDFNQLVPEFGKPSTLFNRTNHNNPVRDLIEKSLARLQSNIGNKTEMYNNQVKPVTTNNYISGVVNVAGSKVPSGSNAFLLSGIGSDIASVKLAGGESDSLDAIHLPKKLAYPYLLVYSDIVENSLFYGSNNDSISNRKLMGYISRNYSNGNYFFSFASGWSYTSDRNRTISYVSTSIHYPDGRLANIDDNSSVIYKIERLRNFMDNTTDFEGILKEVEGFNQKNKK